MFDKLSDNLNMLMTDAHISADELARRTSIPASTIKKIRNRNNPNPTLATLLPLAQYFSVTLDQFIGITSLSKEPIKGLFQGDIRVVYDIPILSWSEAVDWPCTRNQAHETVASEYDYSHNAYALVVEDDGWECLAQGTVLLVDPALVAEHRDFVIIYKEGQVAPTLKQVLYDEDQVYLKPFIQGYNIAKFTDEHNILGVVVEYKKRLKKS